MTKMTVEAYRKKVHKEVVSPSGMTWKLRKMPATVLLKTITMIPADTPTDDTIVGTSPEFREKLPELLMTVIPACCVRPKVTLDPKKSDAKTLTFDEVQPEDMFFLLSEIMELSGLTGEAAIQRKKFREEQGGEDS